MRFNGLLLETFCLLSLCSLCVYIRECEGQKVFASFVEKDEDEEEG